MISLTAAMAASRLAGDAALFFLFGGSGMMALARTTVQASFNRRAVHLAQCWAAGIALLALLSLICLQLVSVGDGWSSALDISLLKIVLFQTEFGQVWLVRLLFVVATLIAVLAARQNLVIAAWAGIALALTALAGHAAMHEGWLGIAMRLSQALHVVCAGAWVGSLVPLVGLLRAMKHADLREAAGHALRRFSLFGHFAVAGVLLTGVTNTFFVLGQWPLHWHSPYQALLGLKICLALAMVLMAVSNRYLWVPRFSGKPDLAARALVRGTLGELTFAIIVLALVSVLGLLEPV